MEIQWFPGHMAKTRKMMEENIALVDAVVEVVDARIPYSSKNPYLDELWRRRPRILALNKTDLADPVKTELWKRWYEAQGYGVVLLDALHGTGIAQIGPMAKCLCQEKIQKEAAKGRQERETSQNFGVEQNRPGGSCQDRALEEMVRGAGVRGCALRCAAWNGDRADWPHGQMFVPGEDSEGSSKRTAGTGAASDDYRDSQCGKIHGDQSNHRTERSG